MSKLDYISIHGFKSIKALEKLTLGPINVIIGANGSGKSNLIGAFAFLHALREGNLSNYVSKSGGAGNILHFGPKATPSMRFHVSFDDEMNQYSISLDATNDDRLFVSAESSYFWGNRSYPRPYANSFPRLVNGEAGISSSGLTRTPAHVQSKLATWRIYHFHDTGSGSALKVTSKLNDNWVFKANGENLPAFLYLLKMRFPESYRGIIQAVSKIAPFFSDFI